MSNPTYNQLWRITQTDLEFLAAFDIECQDSEPQPDRAAIKAAVFELYARYIAVANRLEIVYDEHVQPQKRLLLRRLLDSCIGRAIELKHDLVSLDMMEFNYADAVLAKLRMTPVDLELRIPRYFRRDRAAEIAERQRFVDELLIRFGWLEEERPPEPITELEAVQLLQAHERARQGRLRAHFMKEIRQMKTGKPDAVKERSNGLMAAMRIQKVWRGFAERRKTRRRKLEEMYLIGMIPEPVSAESERIVADERAAVQRRYEVQRRHTDDYEAALVRIREEMQLKRGTFINEQIGDDVRTWFRDYHEKTGKFPEFPSEDAGGSRHLLSRQATEDEMSVKSSAISSKDSKKRDKSKSPSKSADINVEEEFEDGFKASQSMYLSEIRAGIDEYKDLWRDRNETANRLQAHCEELVTQQQYAELEQEIRAVVDDALRLELEQLQAALDRDRAVRGKKSKKNNKTRRSGKKNKKKREKDLTPDRTTESLFEELVANGIIRKYPEIWLRNYLGDRSYVDRSGCNPTPGDIRQIVTEYCILPLGSDTIRLMTPCLRSVLITGPKSSGKKSLVHAICTELGATLFDLTPANIVGKYPGKTGLIMLMHLVSKVSRLLQPSIIYMDDAEKPFMKKVPKGDRTDPKRLKKDLPKLIKNITPEDRIMFVGTTNAPWEADPKLFPQVFQRFLYIPRPDYGDLSYAWKELLSEHIGNQSLFDTGAMAKISDGYTIGSVVRCIRQVITCKRKLQLRVQPLAHAELINVLCTMDPVYREEEEAFVGWWQKTPLGRRFQRAQQAEQELREAEAEKAGNAKSKKKA